MNNVIKIRGARQHNLKNVDLDIPKNKLVVFTGVSGSGKSSLAFDTIYAEGQRRYVESLSTYARQFLGVMKKPDVDVIEGLSPAISIDQKTTSKNPRSTVGTITEIYDYLRLLFARIGRPHCPECGREIASQSAEEIVEQIIEMIIESKKDNATSRFMVLSPIVRDKKGEFSSLFGNLKAKGFNQVRVDGHIKNLSEDFVLLKTNKHTIETVIDKFAVENKKINDKLYLDNLKSRVTDSVEQSLDLSDGLTVVSKIVDKGFDFPEKPKNFQDHLFSEKFACPIDNIQIPEIEPRTFSFNSPHGACAACAGIGKILKVEPELLFSDELTITEGGILPFANIFENDTWYARTILTVCREHSIDPRTEIKNLTKKQIDLLLEGTGDHEYRVEGTNRFGKQTYIYESFAGIINELESKHANTESDYVRAEIEKYMRERTCPECNGARLKPEALGVTIDKFSIHQVTSLSIKDSYDWIAKINKETGRLTKKEQQVGEMIINEILERLKFLVSVGLDYLTLDRNAATLSGGEAQRIRLASQIGSGLTGVLYVLDEPTIGLHQRDNERLIDTLKNLRDLGNTVIVVEHDEDMMRSSDHIIDFGPDAGKKGGAVVAQGDLKKITGNKRSLTGDYLAGRKKVDVELGEQKSMENDKKNGSLVLKGARQYNLKDLEVEFPLNKFVVITGVSGSGKSTLLVETLYPALLKKLDYQARPESGVYQDLSGGDGLDKVVLIDQSPIGRTPRSNPATYTKVFDYIRDVYASTRDAKALGFKKGRFSFNVKGGRCEACEGQGQIKIEMQFMSDIWVTCEICDGKRYNSQTLDIVYKGKNISEVLEMTVEEAYEFFHNHKPIVRKLKTLKDVGLDYIELGQPATTLSGGEAQRIKLSSELSKKFSGDTVYILDEPTTGLHFEDVKKLTRVLKLLVNKGNSVFVIEHNLDVVKNADWVIDLGPEGGEMGGEIISSGKIEEIIKDSDSYTGQVLKKHIN